MKITTLFAIFFMFVQATGAQTTPKDSLPGGPSMQTSFAIDDSVLVTVILKHQQEKNLLEIRRKLESNGFWDLFPPQEARILTWNIVINLGHVITLKLPAKAVRSLNLALENGAWGAFETEVHLSYDYLQIYNDFQEKREDVQKN